VGGQPAGERRADRGGGVVAGQELPARVGAARALGGLGPDASQELGRMLEVGLGPHRVGRVRVVARADRDELVADDPGRGVRAELRRARPARRHHRDAERHRLGERDPEALRPVQGDVAVQGADERVLGGVGEVPVEHDDVRAPRRRGADRPGRVRVRAGVDGLEDQRRRPVGVGERMPVGLDEPERVLAGEHGVVVEDQAEEEGVGRQAELGPRQRRRPGGRDGQRDRVDLDVVAPGGRRLAQGRRHVSRGRPDLVDQRERLRQVGREDRRLPPPHPHHPAAGEEARPEAVADRGKLVGVDADEVRAEGRHGRGGVGEPVALARGRRGEVDGQDGHLGGVARAHELARDLADAHLALQVPDEVQAAGRHGRRSSRRPGAADRGSSPCPLGSSRVAAPPTLPG
jgi:hypothetical protein